MMHSILAMDIPVLLALTDIVSFSSCPPLFAFQACEKAIPYALGAVVFVLLIFAIYVRSVPVTTPQVFQSPVDTTGPGMAASPVDTTDPGMAAGASAESAQAQDDATVPDFLKINPEKGSEPPPTEL
jgi:hypothetical protein